MKVDQVIEGITKQQDKSDEIHVNFYSQVTSLSASIFQGQAKKELWEQWIIPIKLSNNQTYVKCEESDEERL